MAKAIFGEFAAFDTPGGIRFMKDKKMISEKDVPPEVVSFLRKKLTPVLTDEQKAKLRAESLQVKPELQAAPEKLEQDAKAVEDHLTPDDFDPEPAQEKPVAQIPSVFGITPLEPGEPTGAIPPASPDFLEAVSIHTASIEDIAEALYARFGIYTVWLGKFPVADEVNPLTGETFTKYHLGIAYQAAIRAQSRGLLDLDPANHRKALDAGRDASANFRDQFVPQAVTVGENRRANTFDYRTSPVGTKSVAETEIVHETDKDGKVHAVQRPIINGEESETGEKNGAGVRFDRDEDEPLVQPNFSGKPIIRPNW